MEEERNPTKTLLLSYSLLFFVFLLSPKPSSSQPLHSNPSPSSAHNHTHHLRRILLGVLFGSLTGVFAAAIFLLLIRLFILFANRTPILRGPIVFSPSISPKTLQLALSTQSQNPRPIAGKYSQIVLDNDLVVAVKHLGRLNPSNANAPPKPTSNSTKRRVQRELELLARVKHRNVMSLRAYVRDRDRLFMVYDYVGNGSLEDAMKRVRSGQLRLGWEARHRIAVGVVKGLRYLHFECSPRILHHGLKPANVMMDEGFEPRLGDCGLAKLLSGSVDVSGSANYVAPECFQSCRYTDKSDIFSFGMILGVLLTGKDPSDPFFAAEATGRGGLGRWLRHLQQAGEAREALDKDLLGEEVEEEEMLMAVRIALVCLSDLPADRPSSDELVAMLTQLHSF